MANKKVLKGWKKFLLKENEYYGDLPDVDINAYDKYYGRNVIWLGTKGEMFRATPDSAISISGNIFDEDKVEAVTEKILEAEDRVVFYAPYGYVTKIELINVKESIDYVDYPEANIMGESVPVLTTGDKELDDFLVNPDNYDEDEAAELKKELAEAVEYGYGDLGDYTVQIRDGNHRARGAFLSGEPYVYVHIVGLDEMSDEDRQVLTEKLGCE